MITCFRCKETKPNEAFSWRVKGRRRHTLCKTCHNTYVRERWRRNEKTRQGKREDNRRLRRRAILIIEGHKATHACMDCGEARPVCLDFDHVRGKKRFNLANMKTSRSEASIRAEIAKCDVVCANCHRVRHAER